MLHTDRGHHFPNLIAANSKGQFILRERTTLEKQYNSSVCGAIEKKTAAGKTHPAAGCCGSCAVLVFRLAYITPLIAHLGQMFIHIIPSGSISLSCFEILHGFLGIGLLQSPEPEFSVHKVAYVEGGLL